MTQGKKNVLIIDSSTVFLEDLERRFLLEPDYKINTATTGLEGLEKAKIIRPNYVVMSSPLPDADAIQMLNSISMASPQTQSVVVLEVENPMYSSQCIQAGASYTLTKPYSADKLIEILQKLENSSKNMYQGGQSMPNDGNNSLEQLRNAMNQFSQEQDSRNMPQPPTIPHWNQQMPFGQPQQPQQPQGQAQFEQPQGQQQFGGPFQGGQQWIGSPQPQNFYENSGFPPPQMGGHQQMPNMGGMTNGPGEQQRQGGFRTLKQTVIAVNCPKGGVGKTTISKELAIAFANCTVQGQPLKVCLVDCDLDFGDVASMLKLNPYPTIVHWTSDISHRLRENPSGEIKYTQQQIENNYLIHHSTGLKVLSAPSNHTDALEITGKEMEIVIDNLKACDFDVIILDTGNNTKDYTLISLDKAHTILMVTTLDVTTINDTNLLLNTLRSIQFPTDKIKLVVNKMPRGDKDIDTSEISHVLRAPIIGIVPDFPKIRQLNNSGTPATLGRDSEFTQAIRKIGNSIVPVFNRAIPQKKGKKKQGQSGGGLFSKLFKR